MDYTDLAKEFMEIMQQMPMRGAQRQISESVHGEIFLLNYINQQKGNVIPSEISNQIGISTARVAATLNSLENKEWITRKIDVNDRRRILVDITPVGKEQVEKHFQTIMRKTAKMLEYLGEDDAKEYIRIMKKLQIRILKKLEEKDPENFI